MNTAKKSSNFDIQNYFFNLSGATVTENIQLFRRRPNAMKVLFAQMLELDKRCIDVNSMVKTDDGLQCGLTIYSFDPQKQSRSSTLLKICQSAAMKNGTMFTNAVIEIWKLNASSIALNTVNNNSFDIKLTNFVAFFETESKPKHSKYFERDWKNIIESDIYKSNRDIFSSTKIGIYQAISATIDGTTTGGDATTDIVYDDANGNDNNELKQSVIDHDQDNTVCAQRDKTILVESDQNNINDNFNGVNVGDFKVKRESDESDQFYEIKSRDDIEIEMVTKNNLQPIQNMNYSKSGMVANLTSMAAMMDYMTDYDNDESINDDNLTLPKMTHIMTHLSHIDHIKSKHEEQLGQHMDATVLRARSASLSAPIGFAGM